MSEPVAARVETYSGYKADERPVRFDWNGKTLEIERVLSRWLEPDEVCFRVLANDGNDYVLRRQVGVSHANDGWAITPLIRL